MNKYSRGIALVVVIAAPSFAADMDLPNNPLHSKTYVRPNVMLLMDNSGSMKHKPSGSSQSKMKIVKNVAKGVIEDNPDIRFCLAIFNSSQGGKIIKECEIPTTPAGQSQSGIATKIDQLTTKSWTPLAETYYEVIRYFSGKDSVYNSNTSYTSPIQYRCQKNFSIILTDGAPTKDSYFPDLSDMSDVKAISSGNYDGVNNDGNGSSNGNYKYLDDFAKYAWDADLRPSGVDDAGVSFQDPKFSSAGDPGRQNMYTYTIGFNIDDPMLQDAADYGHGIYRTASSATDLKETFNNALKDISNKSQTVSALAGSSSFLTPGVDLNIFQSRYFSKNWSGELLAWRLNPTTYTLETTPVWKAPLPSTTWSDRVLYTGYDNGTLFEKDSFTTDDYNNWFVDPIDLIPYLSGDMSNTTLRTRTSVLGDIINSDPVYITPPLKGRYKDSEFNGQAYSTFAEDNKSRINMIFIGANDGMLHGFNASTGAEILGFFPSKVLSRLKYLAKKDYQHQFFVDGTPAVADVFDNESKTWRTLLVGGLRRGGQSIYALDITAPSLFTQDATNAANTVRWEFGDNNDNDFGYSYSQPQIMRLNDGNFYVVVGNGYNSTEADANPSTTGNAVLYLLNVKDGSIKKKVSTLVGSAQDPSGRGISNGLATVTGFDVENDGKTDYIYAGDLFGNLWKFDLTSSDSNNWGGVLKLFTACAEKTCKTGVDNNHQPITVPIEVAETEYGKTMVFFGTGKLLESQDLLKSNIQQQSIYGLIDTNQVISKSQLLGQKIIYSGDADGKYSADIRVTTNAKVTTQKGWYLDIKVPVYDSAKTLVDKITQVATPTSYQTQGEQVLARARYSKGVVTFYTKALSNQIIDPCSDISAKSFAMELNALSGSRLGAVRSDVNGDGVVDDKDSLDTGSTNRLGKKEFIVVSGVAGGNGSGGLEVSVIGSNNKVTDKVISIKPGNGDNAPPPTGKSVRSGYRTAWREIIQN